MKILTKGEEFGNHEISLINEKLDESEKNHFVAVSKGYCEIGLYKDIQKKNEIKSFITKKIENKKKERKEKNKKNNKNIIKNKEDCIDTKITNEDINFKNKDITQNNTQKVEEENLTFVNFLKYLFF